MSSPEQNSVIIRLEVSVPVGVSVVGAAPLPGAGKKEHSERKLFKRPQPPNDETRSWPVLPNAATGLGTICAQVEYDDTQNQVWAAAYPAIFFPKDPDETFPMPTFAQPGTGSNKGRKWNWGPAGAVQWAAHSAAGVPNKLAFWYQTNKGDTPVFDGASAFAGATNPNPCGSSGSGTQPLPAEVADARVLRVIVPDGDNKGDYPAKGDGNQVWKAAIGATALVITVAAGGLVMQSASGTIPSTGVTLKPFLAKFCGREFGSKDDVLVML